MIEKYGADALRMGLLVGSVIGHDIRFDEEKVKSYKHFANKLWNITRFVLENYSYTGQSDNPVLSVRDKQIVEEAQQKVLEVTAQMEKYRLDMAIGILYPYVWDYFAGEILEESKSLLKGPDTAAAHARTTALYESLKIILKLLHPFMPFITEEIWQSLPIKDTKFLMVAKWPTADTLE
jgi:valyl-tRNA synthetase